MLASTCNSPAPCVGVRLFVCVSCRDTWLLPAGQTGAYLPFLCVLVGFVSCRICIVATLLLYCQHKCCHTLLGSVHCVSGLQLFVVTARGWHPQIFMADLIDFCCASCQACHACCIAAAHTCWPALVVLHACRQAAPETEGFDLNHSWCCCMLQSHGTS